MFSLRMAILDIEAIGETRIGKRADLRRPLQRRLPAVEGGLQARIVQGGVGEVIAQRRRVGQFRQAALVLLGRL